MNERLKVTAKILGYVGAAFLVLDVAWVVLAAHVHTITPHEYMTVMVLISTLGVLSLIVAVLVAGIRILNREAERREVERMDKCGLILAAVDRIEQKVGGPAFAAGYLNGARQRLGDRSTGPLHYRARHPGDDLH